MLKNIVAVALAPLPVPPWANGSERGLHLRWRWGWLRGWLARPNWRVRELLGGTRIRVGRRFSLLGRLKAHGPGEVIFGDDVTVDALTTPLQLILHCVDRSLPRQHPYARSTDM